MRQKTYLKAQKCSKFHRRASLHDGMFEFKIIHAKAKAWVFPYKFCSYFIGRGLASHAKSWIQLRANTVCDVHYHFVFLSPGSYFKSVICIWISLESTLIVLFLLGLKEGKLFTRKVWGLLWPWCSIQRLPKLRFMFFLSILSAKEVFFSILRMKTGPWKFVDLASNATCLPEEACWFAKTITNCVHAEEILLKRLAKNITHCVIMIYITLCYITLHFGVFLRFFRIYISSRGSIICRLVRPSGLPDALTRWQYLPRRGGQGGGSMNRSANP